MKKGVLGKTYEAGDVIIREGEVGDTMYEILEGEVEIIQQRGDRDVHLATLRKGDFFGEMSIFEKEVRSATVRALGSVRALTIDKRILLRRISEDPSLALRILEKMSNRIREMDSEIVRLQTKS